MKKTVFLLIALCGINFYGFAQFTAIPDTNFEAALIAAGIDSGSPDGQVLTASAAAKTGTLSLTNKNIVDLTGIKAFTGINQIDCDKNLLTSIDISGMTNITRFNCFSNPNLTTINVTGCTALDRFNCYASNVTTLIGTAGLNFTRFFCYQNPNLTSLNVATNLNLQQLLCYDTAIASLDLRNNNKLTFLRVQNNPNLNYLNVKNGANALIVAGTTTFVANNNPLLSCIEVDNVSYSNSSWTAKDAGTTFSTNCSVLNAPIISQLSSDGLNTITQGCGGSTLVINGNFFIGATGVAVNGVAVTSFSVVDKNKITAALPLVATSGLLTVTTAGGTVSSTATFTIVANSENVTKVSACGTYTWANNGETYITSGIKTGTTSNCVTELLDLTITPVTTNGSVTIPAACGASYTWPLNGQTFNTPGIYTYTVGCNTATLTYTLTPETTEGSESVSACGNSYTWPLNEQTYVESGSYTQIEGCNTAILNLTLTPNTTTNVTVEQNVGTTYTWPLNGQTYNTTGSYTHELGCNSTILNLTIAPTTSIPDTNFEQALITLGIDTDGIINGQILTSNAASFTGALNLDSKNITDFTGIKAFTSISSLSAKFNPNTTLDISGMTNITVFAVEGNPNITAVNVAGCKGLQQLYATGCSNLVELNTTGCSAITRLYCYDTKIASLNLSTATLLDRLYCYNTLLTSLDVSKSPVLTRLYCYNNPALTALNLKSGGNLMMGVTHFRAATNPVLTCIQVDDIAYSSTNWTNKDAVGVFSIDCFSQIPTFPLSFCKGATVATAVGSTTLKFYSALTGGTALLSTSALSTKTYFVTETVNSVESTPRVPVVVTINALPTQAIGAITSNTAGTTAGTFAAATLAVGAFVGTTTTVAYRVPAFTSSDAYFWTVPAGVRIVGQAVGVTTVLQTGENANVLNVNYSGIAAGIGSVGAISVQAQNAHGCNGTAKSVKIAKALPLAPAAITMHDLSLPLPTSGIPTAVKSFAKYMGTNAVLRLTATPSVAATSYEWNLPAGVNQLSGGTTNVITVNFAGVTSANTDNFTTTAGVSTNVLRIGVKAVNGVGVSTTSNSALVNPTTTSTARLLTLTAVRPAAPTLKMFDMAVSSTVAVTDISKYIGSHIPLTLVGTVAATTLASSFSWELAEGVNVVAGSVLSSNSIIVNFEDVEPGTASLYVGIKAVNGMGSSVKSNATATPATSSTATLLKLSAGLPSAAGTVVGSLAICSNQASSVTYTITAAASKTNVYIITSPVGTTITGGVMNTRTINAVAGTTFTVNYPNGFTSVRPTQRSISIQSVNGFGVSVPKLLTLTSNACTTSSKTAKVAPIAQEFKVIAYPNPSSGVFNLAIESSNKAATTIQVYDMQGRMIESKQVNTNAVEIGANYTSGIYNVILENAGQAKTIRLIKK